LETDLVLSGNPESLVLDLFPDLFEVGEPLVQVKKLGVVGSGITERLTL